MVRCMQTVKDYARMFFFVCVLHSQTAQIISISIYPESVRAWLTYHAPYLAFPLNVA